MRKPTPLQIFVELLTGQDAPNDARTLRALARRYARTRRAREIAEYLIAAADERLPRNQKAGGSLKHVLWRLRDIAGDLYEQAAREVLKYLLVQPRIPLSNVLPHVRHLSTVGVFADAIGEQVDWRDLRRFLDEASAGPWKVAVNTTPRNLTDAAMRLGYDVMVAHSPKGVVVKARRGLRVDATALPGDAWKQVYPDLAIWTGTPSSAPALSEIIEALPKAVKKAG